ncbi:phospholipid scramblase 2 isoform X2 [Ovis aries]|uniref:phospholipid scramblase 2 isoform X2 n=1 Tax=Ovis aries TaxID=9940 RepID=UPI001C2EB0A9|nr:phospholipid scramblase 2 isoform X2 [Ovis aries]XP_042091806.1 phospholipid scramblase 2 isoform X2 [Ovis aries]XP_042091812.1 phospholipid scramblase 1 isoform X2 [Ovis aries]
MDKQNMQINAPHLGTNLTGPPGHIGYSDPQAGYQVPPPDYASPGPVGLPVQYQPVTGHPGEPTQVPWMPAPLPPLNCPPGLEYLTQIDQLLIHQQMELLEVLIGFETNNRYEIKNSLGQRIYFAAEDTDCCTRNCCGPARPFTMKILDNMGREVITLERPLRCASCCFPCCLQEVKSLDEKHVVGRISKHWTGLIKELFTDADNFGIQFPLDLDVKMKAVMLGACFLIDFMFFEMTTK